MKAQATKLNRTSKLNDVRARPIHFELDQAPARSVCIAGSFNEWHPNVTPMISVGGGRWLKELTLSPGTYEYRFVVDGNWMSDPNNAETKPNPFGESNSVLSVASA